MISNCLWLCLSPISSGPYRPSTYAVHLAHQCLALSEPSISLSPTCARRPDDACLLRLKNFFIRSAGGEYAEASHQTEDSARIAPPFDIMISDDDAIKPRTTAPLLVASVTAATFITYQAPTTAATSLTMDVPPHNDSQQERQQQLQTPQSQGHLARVSRSTLVLPPRTFGSAQRLPICSFMHHGGGAKIRRASTCVSIGSIAAGGGSGELTDITDNAFRQQQQDRQSGRIPPALKRSSLLPFLKRSPRVKGALPVRFSAYSCHGTAPGPDASCDAAAAKIDGRSSSALRRTTTPGMLDIDGGVISAGRRRITLDRGTTDLDRITSSMQLIAAGRPLGEAMSELRRAAKAWKQGAAPQK